MSESSGSALPALPNPYDDKEPARHVEMTTAGAGHPLVQRPLTGYPAPVLSNNPPHNKHASQPQPQPQVMTLPGGAGTRRAHEPPSPWSPAPMVEPPNMYEEDKEVKFKFCSWGAPGASDGFVTMCLE